MIRKNLGRILLFISIVTAFMISAMTPDYNLLGSIVYHAREERLGSKKITALTFDDGPYGEPTAKILDILKEKKVKATFFLVGEDVARYPELVKREVAEGHIVGNHSMDHARNLASEPIEKFKKNIEEAEDVIMSTTGLKPRFFRPPFGLTSTKTVSALYFLGYTTVMWDDMTNDWRATTTPERITERILHRLKPGSIIVLHDGRDTHKRYPRENVIETLPGLIDKIRERDYELVTLDKLIDQKPYFQSK